MRRIISLSVPRHSLPQNLITATQPNIPIKSRKTLAAQDLVPQTHQTANQPIDVN
ncbi:MAG: hypothetical protein ACK456_16120 [Pseudanabaenaceae cyanobacterium]